MTKTVEELATILDSFSSGGFGHPEAAVLVASGRGNPRAITGFRIEDEKLVLKLEEAPKKAKPKPAVKAVS